MRIKRDMFVLIGNCLVFTTGEGDERFDFRCLNGGWDGHYDTGRSLMVFHDRNGRPHPEAAPVAVDIVSDAQPPENIKRHGYKAIVAWMSKQANPDADLPETGTGDTARRRNDAACRLLSDADARIDRVWHLGSLVATEGFLVTDEDDLVEAMFERKHPSFSSFTVLGPDFPATGRNERHESSEELSSRLIENGLLGFVARVATPVPHHFSATGDSWNSSWGMTRTGFLYSEDFAALPAMAAEWAGDVLEKARARHLEEAGQAASQQVSP